MNSLRGHIVGVETSKNLSIVSVSMNEQLLLKAIVIETRETAPYLQKGRQISMLFKETEVLIGSGEQHAISLQNKIPATIKHVDKGTLLSKLLLETPAGQITAIISSDAVVQLGLKNQLKVTAMIKLNEMMLSEL